MGKARFLSNPYPDVVLTQADCDELLALENRLLEENFRKYESFVVHDHRKVDEVRWKKLTTDENLHVYVERERWMDESEDEVPTDQVPPETVRNNLPKLLCVGTFHGELNDLMFGTVNPTQDIMRVKASYVKDYDDGAVLANVIVPTVDDPFRSVTVKWTQINLPLGSTRLVCNRDFVCLEATGVLHFANGDRVGHTITGFYRQTNHNVIDTFAFDTVDPGGKVIRKLALLASGEALLSTNNYVTCGQKKKLNWLLQRRVAEARFNRQRSSTRNGFQDESVCVVCKRTLTPGSFGLPRMRGLGKSTCKLCMNPVCSHCKVVKPISFLSPDGKLFKHKISFCRLCICEVNNMDALQAARDQAEGYGAYKMMQSLSGSDTLSDDLNE
ncbi:hypothetical protein BBO99_00008641 [Phytophthora kernoviae]|uniref:FYVE-type domain-containing protein n=2 Tax=Phytophthora kernoviae TaxID=325452 RepID=A0A3R7JPJ9_9STRA|nr:hypothetical protein G195_010227 [Phytophthora kernoviae 00238/432]KAG2511591.1 hypothetical protein JM16_008232 [Phytophthora kernoviae]RLN45551.1 hypothetical protein BBI17_008494 [Phytophthora kernoviae]RLN74942.1 hypothetical protein BBO99_00008641 [Phytophthora kernoviae]